MKDPYPSLEQRESLCRLTGLLKNQLINFMINERKRNPELRDGILHLREEREKTKVPVGRVCRNTRSNTRLVSEGLATNSSEHKVVFNAESVLSESCTAIQNSSCTESEIATTSVDAVGICKPECEAMPAWVRAACSVPPSLLFEWKGPDCSFEIFPMQQEDRQSQFYFAESVDAMLAG